MELKGEERLPMAPTACWRALNNPEVLKACIPGCDSIEQVSQDELRLGMLVAVGPLKARFGGTLRLSDVLPPHSYTMNFEGSGGAAGFGKGRASVQLVAADDDHTLLTYAAEAQVGGKIAQIGSRLVDAVARRMAEEFFNRFKAAAEAEADRVQGAEVTR